MNKDNLEKIISLRHKLHSIAEISDVFPETKNDEKALSKVLHTANQLKINTIEMQDLWRASEDFGWYQKKCSGAIFYIGNGENYPSLHTAEYDFNDNILETAVDMFKGLYEQKQSLSLDMSDRVQRISPKYDVLKKYFGYNSFRTEQERLIDDILNGRDVLAVMPTGAGKSLCYQVPALIMQGITIVVSPLISLMKDQVHALNEAGIGAAYINSSLSENQITKALSIAAQGKYKIIYAAPERLETWGFQNFARQVDISLLAVDEAHCISQWGQDFRPSYMNIPAFINILKKRPVIAAFTATATDRVRDDIAQSLSLQNPDVLVTGFDRPNLYFSVKKPKKKLPYLVHFLREHEDESGIIYCATRKNVDKVFEKLVSLGFSATRYHAGLSEQERRDNQDDFTYDRKNIVVATNAFGMGIDKSNVRFVVHFNMPQSIENYYQEAGRAGRDGLPAVCMLLYSPQDIMLNRFIINSGKGNANGHPDYNSPEENRLQQMIHYCTGSGCLRDYILQYFGEEGCDMCGNCSRCLHETADDEEYYENNEDSKKTHKEKKNKFLQSQ